MMKVSIATYIGAKISKSSQLPLQADGLIPLSIIGETHLSLSRNGTRVVEDLDVDILAGTPFMTTNDIAGRSTKHEIIIAGSDVVSYGPTDSTTKYHAIRSCHVLRAPPTNTTIRPGGFLDIEVPTDFPSNTQLAIEPRVHSSSCRLVKSWPQPNILDTVGGKLRLVNPSDEPILIKKNDHLCQTHLVTTEPSPEISTSRSTPPDPLSSPPSSAHICHSESVCVDPDGIVSPNENVSRCAILN